VAPSPQATNGRREEILQTAKRLFAELGYRETNLNHVAEQLGFRRQALYHYFASKDEVLLELMEHAGGAIQASSQVVFESDLPPVDKLRDLVRVHVREVLNDPDIFRIQFEEVAKLGGERVDAIRRDQNTYVERVAGVIEAGQQDGTLQPVPSTTHALLIIGMCNWTVHWYGPDSKLSIEEIAEYTARLAIEGLQRHP
jgi:AcrR family transcriptional regulator